MNLKGKRLLILGGQRISCEIVKHAQDMGITVGVTDWYELDRSPAKQMADEAYFESTSDIDVMEKLIKENNFDGVITGFTDSVLPYYAEMCERCNLPAYGTREQFEVLIDKSRYKALMRDFDVPTIPEYQINVDEIEASCESVEFPVLVKPSDSSGARGITICHDSAELAEAVEFAKGASQTKTVLVEKYMDGAEATIFWIFDKGEYHVMLMGNRHVKENQGGVIPLPVGYTYPAALLPKFLKETAPRMKEMFRSIGIENGMLFMQCKIENDVPYVYDIGYRLTGSLEYKNIKESCGFDPLDMLIRFAVSGDYGEPDLASKIDPYLGGGYSFNVSMLSKPGKIAELRGIEEVRAMPQVIDVYVAHPAGDEITEKMKGLLAQITVRVLGKADSIDEMKQLIADINSTIRIISTEGEELQLPGIEESDYADCIYA